MVTDAEIAAWFQHTGLPETARAVIDEVRSSPPARSTRGARGNVTVRFPSRKMGCIIQGESHTVELAFVRVAEHDPACLAYWDQPHPPVWLHYCRTDGRRVRPVARTADYFVLWKDSAGWVECKTERELRQKEEENPNLYCRRETGQWHCPPGERYAAQFGLQFRVYSSAEINWMWQENMEFLDDYRRGEDRVVSEEVSTALLTLVTATPGITVAALLARVATATADDLFALIVADRVYVDLHTVRLAQVERASVYCDAVMAAACTSVGTPDPLSAFLRPRGVLVACGARIVWEGKPWTIVSLGSESSTTLTLHSVEEPAEVRALSLRVFETLAETGQIIRLPAQEQSALTERGRDLLAGASMQSRARANERFTQIAPYLREDPPALGRALPRTIRRWRDAFRTAQRTCGCGYVGLLPQRRTGDPRAKLLPKTQELMEWYIAHHYETTAQSTRYAVWRELARECAARSVTDAGFVAPSYVTFCAAVKRRPRYEQVVKRQGTRVAQAHAAWYWELDQTTPRHGGRPFAIVHLDHTQLDVEVVDSRTGHALGRPWVTLLVDAHTRRLLALYLTFQVPSTLSCMMALRICVRRFGRLPQTLVVDGAREFRSTAFETVLARYEVTKKTRPWHQPHFGSVCERLIGTANTAFVHLLAGNTQITAHVRQMTPAVAPRRLACWTLADLWAHLCVWADEVYDATEHMALGMSPREAWHRGLAQSGAREHLLVRDDEEFRRLTLPSTRKGTATVQTGHGVKINYLYYWCPEFQDPQVQGTQVEVVFDPFDASAAEAYVTGRWRPLSAEYRAAFLGHSVAEVLLAAEELRQRDRVQGRRYLQLTATRLADHLTATREHEALLLQRRRDAEHRAARDQVRPLIGGRADVSVVPEDRLHTDSSGSSPCEDEQGTVVPENMGQSGRPTFGRFLS